MKKSIQEFLSYLNELDVRLWSDEGRLRCNAPQDALTPTLRAELAERKAEILDFLKQANFATSSTDQPIRAVPRNGNLPLSFAQQGLWFIDQLERESTAYNQLFAVHLCGSLNVALLEQALTEIVRRHEVLRTTFPNVDGQPVQVIAPNPDLSLSVVDLSDLPEAKQSAEIQQLAISELDRPFNLSQLPLLRVTLLQLKEAEYVLLFAMHHIVADGWSGGIIIRELAALYEAFSIGKPSPLPALPIQYADFASWEQQRLRGAVLEEQLTYWTQQLADAPPILQLPCDRPRPAVQTFRGATTTLKLGVEVTQRLKQLSQQEGATLFMTLLAAFQVLLYRYTNQDDICVGTTLANRHSRDLESLVGFFVNTLVLRTDLSGNPSFQELLGRVRGVALEAYNHPDLPFNLLVEKLQPERNLSHTPLFQVMFVLENAPIDTLELPGLTLSPLEIPIATAKFDLSLSMRETEQGLFGKFEYNTDLFDAATITRMVGHFQTLLSAIAANPQQRVCELPLLTEAEQYQLLVEWNNTQADYPKDACIHQLFEAQVERTPDAVAVVFEQQQLTYQQLNQRANQLAHHLKQLGVEPDVLVGICVERSLEMVVGLLGILKAGGAYVPLDPAYPQQRLALMVSDSQMPFLLTQQQLLERLPKHQARVVCLDRDWHTISQESQDHPASSTTPENLAYVIYTSGSTGKPKGVQIPHGGVVNFLNSMQRQPGLTQTDVLLAVTSISFDIAALELYLPLITGARVVLVSREVASDGKQLIEQLTTSGARVMQATPATWQMLLAAGWVGSSQLKILCGGEALPCDLAQQLLARGAAVWNLYGPTETTIWSTACQVEAAKLVKGTVPIGRPIANTQVYLLDPFGQPVPLGIAGELHIGGAGLARGYLNRPELTEQKFIHHRVAGRLYKTGDLARYLADGTIEYIERIDHQVKLRGFRIELGEIESLVRQHPAVEQAVVILREDEPGHQRLVSYLVPNRHLQGQLIRQQLIPQLRSFLQQTLPSYMSPSAFVTLDALPLTPNGKVDRRALPAPEMGRTSLEEAFVAPRNPVEEVLAGIWSQLLGIDQVGIDDNFFELGGHSLLATQVISRIENAFGIELPMRCLFESPTLAALSEEIQEAIKAEPSLKALPIKAVSRNNELPLSFAQARLWFLDRLEPGNAFYNIPVAVHLSGSLDVAVLEQSLNEIVRRHEALRTKFCVVNGQPVQVISRFSSFTLPVVDLHSQNTSTGEVLSKTKLKIEAQRLATKEACKPFDLARDLLVRVTLLRLDQSEYILLLTMHHIVSDAWSISVLVRELAVLYETFSKRNASLPQASSHETTVFIPIPLSELPIQYADFAVWQRQWLQEEVLEKELSYWKQQLDGAPTLLQLPIARSRPPVQTFRGTTQIFELPQTLTEALKALSRETEATLFMTLLAAFNTLLYRYTGAVDILVGSPIANRNRAEMEPLIGCFANTLVLRTDLSGNPSFRQLLKRVREVALGAYAHQDLPFEKLVEELHLERDLSHPPLFQVMFSLQNALTTNLELPGLTLHLSPVDTKTAKFDLTLDLIETPSGLVGRLEYNTDLFDAEAIARTIGHFHNLLEGIVAAPERPISELPLLSEAERHQLLVEWNDTRSEYPHDQCIHQLFEAQVERTPDAVAVVFEQQQLTYQQLNQRANQLAHYLKQLGVKPDVLVGICVERSLEMVVGLLGILKAGGAYVPLDPTYPQERLAFMLSDSQVSVLLTQRKLLPQLPKHEAHVICLDTDWEVTLAESEENFVSNAKPFNLAYVIYTSGSTGKPKGTMIPHQGVVNYLSWCTKAYAVAEGCGAPVNSSIGFDATITSLFSPLLVGQKVVLLPEEQEIESLSAVLRSKSNFSLVKITPAHLEMLSQLLPSYEGTAQARALIIGGEALLAKSLAFWRTNAPDTRLINEYGPTETVVGCCVYEVSTQTSLSGAVSIGRPIANTQIYLLDQHLQPVPIGVPGELHIGGDGLARGYLNRPELTDEKFVSNPYNPGTRLYKTGDLARYLPDGNIEYLGRIDHQVKIRGFRIELGEIEACLSQHPEVREAVVVAREDVSGSKRLIAYIVPQEKPGSTVSELRSFLKQKLPDYMVPSAFVMLDSLPLTPNGKVDRRALPAPDRARFGSEKTLISPRTPIEEVLAGIWAQVLGCELVSIHDNFFDLGGHSLLATQVIGRLRSVLQVELPLRCLFESPTIAELAESVAATMKAGQKLKAPPILPVPRDGKLPLSFAQERLWLVDRLEPNNTAYNIPAAVRLVGSLNITALEQSFNEIGRRHEVLRTTFTDVDGQPVQLIAPSLTLKIPVVDLQALPETEREAEALRLADRDAQLPFDLARGPMLRVTLLKLGLSEHVVLLTMHHIVSDAWSDGVFVRELALLYEAFCAGQPSPLPELSIQYADFAHWQRQWLQGDVLETLLSYWQQQLAGAPTTLDLKKIAGEPPVTTLQEEGTGQFFVLPADLSETLRTLSRQEGVTLFMTLLAAFQTLLYRYTQQDDIVVGTDIANRDRAEVEPLIGFFINLLVLRTDLSGNPSFRGLLARVREVALGAYAHQDMPFAKLVEVLRPDRRSSTTPLFQVLFVLQNTPMPPLELSDLTISPLEINTGKAKFDLALFMKETEQGLAGLWKYNTELFDAEAIAHFSHHFETLLSSIVKNPDTRIDTLEMLSEAEKQKQLAEQAQREKAKLNKFKTIKPKAVSLPQKQLIKTSFLQPEQALPLVIERDSDEIDLADWASSHREFIETNLLKHGAILFRGFNLNSAADFENVANAIHPNLFGEYGDLPREGVSGKVYGSTPYPPDKAILFHNESSHLHRWPLKIWFFCVQPAQQGGETPILDCRKIYQLLNPRLREKFEEKQLMYVRNYIDGLDVSWQDFFHTTDKAEVENYCRQAGMEFEWLENNGLKTRKIRPAVAKHSKTGELVFFNQLQLHHVSCLDSDVRQSLLSVFGEDKLPRNVCYGDGTPIEDSVMEEIGAIYQENQISFTWHKGDILMLDNMLTSHSRNPYVGSRKIVVAMGELITNTNV